MYLVNTKRTTRNKKKVLKAYYYSPDTKLKKTLLRYTPANMSRRLLEEVKSKIDTNYLYSEKRRIKHNEELIVGNITQRIVELYFEWVILKCIAGYRVYFMNDSDYVFFIHPYYPDEIEDSRRTHIDKLYNVHNEHIICNNDFKGRRFRLSMYERVKYDDIKSDIIEYKYADYFIRLSPKYKRLLEQEIKKNPNKYDHTLQF